MTYDWHLRRAGVDSTAKIYPNGGHGYGLRRLGRATDTWSDEAASWLAQFARPSKKVLFLGDSITDKHHVGCKKNYWGFLGDWYGFSPLVYGINGQQMSDIPAQADKYRSQNKSPSEFKGITIDNYCQGLIHLRKHPKFLDELEPRRKQGYKTTFYVCASAMKPNTFMDSPFDEGYWLGAYPAITGFDGFLRWAANSWPKDPYVDASYRPKDWRAGDTFFIYPNGELSSRLIALRNGVVAAEKLRILKEAGVDVSKEVADIASKYDYKTAIYGKLDFPAFTRAMEDMVNR